MSKTKIIIIATLAALITETISALLFSNFGHIGGDGPDTMGFIGLFLHFPGILLSDKFHLVGWVDFILIELISVIQYILLYWFAIILWKRIRRVRGKLDIR